MIGLALLGIKIWIALLLGCAAIGLAIMVIRAIFIGIGYVILGVAGVIGGAIRLAARLWT